MLKISVITACFNNEDTIEDTLKSLALQDYPNIEYIIVDGKSNDQTLLILKKYENKITTLVSEKDDGLYHALNKGIQLATGDVIGFLHADDFFADAFVVSKIANSILNNNVDAVYGDLQYVDRVNSEKISRTWTSGNYRFGRFFYGWMPPHPTFYVKRACFNKFGSFNTQLKSSADYELMLRFVHKNNVSVFYIPQVLVKMRVGGKSNITFRNRILANREDYKAWKINNLKPKFYTLFLKPISKITQFFDK